MLSRFLCPDRSIQVCLHLVDTRLDSEFVRCRISIRYNLRVLQLGMLALHLISMIRSQYFHLVLELLAQALQFACVQIALTTSLRLQPCALVVQPLLCL